MAELSEKLFLSKFNFTRRELSLQVLNLFSYRLCLLEYPKPTRCRANQSRLSCEDSRVTKAVFRGVGILAAPYLAAVLGF